MLVQPGCPDLVSSTVYAMRSFRSPPALLWLRPADLHEAIRDRVIARPGATPGRRIRAFAYQGPVKAAPS
jgi:hypothetical protein